MAVSNQSGAIFDSYSESIDAQGELVITATYQGQNQIQTMSAPPSYPAPLYFDTSIISFLWNFDAGQITPTMQYVKTVASIS